MSDYVNTYELWLEFEKLEHFADKCKLAEEIASSMWQDDSRAMYDPLLDCAVLNKALHFGAKKNSYLYPQEYSAFTVRTLEGLYHVFFIDEDRLPICAVFDVAEENVYPTFKTMVVRTSLNDMGCADTESGVRFHVEDEMVKNLSMDELLAAYILLVEEHSNYPIHEMREKLRNFLLNPATPSSV